MQGHRFNPWSGIPHATWPINILNNKWKGEIFVKRTTRTQLQSSPLKLIVTEVTEVNSMNWTEDGSEQFFLLLVPGI